MKTLSMASLGSWRRPAFLLVAGGASSALLACIGLPDRLTLEAGQLEGSDTPSTIYGDRAVQGSDGDASWVAAGLEFPIRYHEPPDLPRRARLPEGYGQHDHQARAQDEEEAAGAAGAVLGEHLGAGDDPGGADEGDGHWWESESFLGWLRDLAVLILVGERGVRGGKALRDRRRAARQA